MRPEPVEGVDAEITSRIAGYDWWHAIEVAPGVVTPGGWDLRPTAERMPWPGPLTGLRCLDVGTMDGFWAFEMERRGAAEVVAVDLLEPGRQDAPPRPGRSSGGPTRGETFRVAAELLGSRATLLDRSIYDLDPADLGRFDLVTVGYVLQMLRDPLRGLEAVRRVCQGHLVLLDTVSAPLSFLPSPLARLNARRGALEWFVFNRAGLHQILTMAGFTVETMTPVLRDRANPAVARRQVGATTRLKHQIGLLGRSIAVRAHPIDLG